MTTSETPPRVFVRNATGLRKEAGALDVFVYNTNNQNIGLGVAFLGLGIGAYAGGLLPLSALLATVLVIPLYMVYSRLSADMPRSGGDYVWTSRIFGPGSARRSASWSPGPGSSWPSPRSARRPRSSASSAWPAGCAAWPWPPAPAGFESVGNWVSGETGAIVVGSVLLLFFTVVLIRGVRTYMRIQNWTFLLAMLGILLEFIAGLVSPHRDFNQTVQQLRGEGGRLGARVRHRAGQLPGHARCVGVGHVLRHAVDDLHGAVRRHVLLHRRRGAPGLDHAAVRHARLAGADRAVHGRPDRADQLRRSGCRS